MRTKKIFTPMIAVGLAISLSVGADLDITIYEGVSQQIDNLDIQQYPDGISDVSTYYYVNPSTHTLTQIHNLIYSFANRTDPNHLVLESDTQGNGNIAFGGLNSIAWTDWAGLFIDTLTIDLQHSDSTPKHFSLLFGDGGEVSIAHSNYQIGKSLLKITNGTNRNNTTNITFGGVVKSDFLIDSLSTNTITFSKDYDWKSIENIGDITISGNDSKNIFNFEDVTYRGTFTNAISTDTQINLDGATRFDSDITTNGGGLTTIHILNSQVSLQHYDKSTNAYTPLTFSTDANSKNIIDISPKLGYSLTLNSFFQGNNTVVFHDNHNIGGPGSGDLIIQTLSGNSNIDIGNNAYINLDTFSITTKKGVSNINFIGESATLFPAYYDVIFKTDGGDNFFNFKKNGTFNIQAILQADNGSNHFVIDHNITLQGNFNFYGSEQLTNKNVFDIYANSSLLLQNIDFNLQSGNMEINFKGNGGKGIFKGSFDNISNGSTITINTESQAYGVMTTNSLGNYTSTNTLNLQENSTFELIDGSINFQTLNVSGSQANLIMTSNYTSSHIEILDTVDGENLIVTSKKGLDDEDLYPNYLTLSGSGNELRALKIIKPKGYRESDRLSLEQGPTSILEEVEILENRGVNFALNGNSASLTLKNNLVNSGEVRFTFGSGGGTLNSNIQSNDTGITTFVFNQANGTYSINGVLSTLGKGKNIFDLTSKSATISNDLVFSGRKVLGEGGNIINIGANQTLTLQNSVGGVSTIRSIVTNEGVTHLNFNGDNSTLSGNISTSSGNTIIDFSGDSQLSGTLEISDIGNTEIIVKSGKTGVISKPITANGETLNINLGDNSTLTLNGNLSTAKGETTISFTGSSGAISGTFIIGAGASTAFELGASDSQSVVATITGTLSNANGTGGTNSNYNGGENFFAINAKDTTLINDSNGLVFTSGSNTISFENTSGATLHWRGTSSDTEQNIATTGGNTEIKFSNSGTIAGGISISGGNTTLYLGGREDGSKIEGVINGAIISSGKGANNVEFDNSNNTLILKDNATFSQVSNLSDGNNNGISFYHTSRSSTDFKTLTIGSKDSTSGISGNGLNFLVYAISNTPEASLETQPSGRITQGNTSKAYADKIVIHSSSNKEATTHNLGVVFENQDNINLDAISYTKGSDNNILIASVSNNSKVSFNTQSTLVLGFDVARIDYVTESTDENGNISGSGYTSYFVGKARAKEVVEAEQAVTATAFMLNYDLYMANLNSLNKRMGELRENAHSQGVWARVFNGALTNSFGLESKSNYTTIQAGYDYAFGFEGANNYLGVALSYALSTSTSQNAFDENGQRRGIDGIYSNAVEVALYNSYVSDNGWYNDSIAKFSYIMSKFDINNLNDNTSTSNDTSNFAFTLSDEVGYVFKLGEAKEWSITPQIEATFGYFSQSDFKQTLANSNIYLDSMAENVLTLRTRVGSAFAYDFKNFTQKDTFNASLYIGAFYEYDYVSGGEIKMSTQRETQTNKYSNLSSDGRVVMNVGTNMSIKDNTRLYFDFEKSFAGKITTDYQVNFGVRYSFGESDGYTPMIEKAEFKAPLKVEEESKEEQEDKEKTENKVQKDNQAKEEKKEQKETGTKEDSTPQDK